MANDISLTDEKIEKVLTYIPVFESPGFIAGEVVSKKGEFPYMSYSPEVLVFIRDLHDSGLIRPFDWCSWQNEAVRYYEDPSRLDFADLDTLSKLLTLHIRKDRFCEGHFAEMITSGHIVAILKRLQNIRNEKT